MAAAHAKTMERVRLNLIFTMRDTYINSSLNLLTKVPSSRGTAFKDIQPSMEHLSSNHSGCPNQHKNSYKLYNETGHHVFSLMKSK